MFAKSSGVKRTSQSKRRPELDGVRFNISNTLPKAYRLKHEIIERLARGDLYSGTPIVPITLDVIKIDKGAMWIRKSSKLKAGLTACRRL